MQVPIVRPLLAFLLLLLAGAGQAQLAPDWWWDEVEKMKPLHMWTFGKQLVLAADSVCANLIEGGNRHGDADQLHFFIIARASAEEAIYWIRRARRQQALSPDESDAKSAEMRTACMKLNSLIGYRRSKPLKVRELRQIYAASRIRNPDEPESL